MVSAGNHDAFLAKLNPAGELLWARRAGGQWDDASYGLKISGGFIFISGRFDGTANFNTPSVGGSNEITSAGGSDGFLAKFDSDGTFKWARRLGGDLNDSAIEVAVTENSIYITGDFRNTANFNTPFEAGINEITSAGEGDVFIAKYDWSGTFQWAKRAGGAKSDIGTGIAAYQNSIFITGRYIQTCNFNTPSEGGINELVAPGPNNTFVRDAFVAKFDDSGAFQWARRAGGDDIYSPTEGRAVSATGDAIYVTGTFRGTANFYTPLAEGNHNVTSAGFEDIFLAKYTQDGVIQWAKRSGGAGIDLISTIAASNNAVAIVGVFQSPVNFNTPSNFETNEIIPAGDFDGFVAKYDATGAFKWSMRAGGVEGDSKTAVVISGDAVYTGGYFRGKANFNTPSSFGTNEINSEGSLDMFVARYVPKIGQAITFNSLPIKTIDDEDFPAGATASSGLEVSYSCSNPEIATIENGMIVIHAPGSTMITASQAGNEMYAKAQPIAQILNIHKRPFVTVWQVNNAGVLIPPVTGENFMVSWEKVGDPNTKGNIISSESPQIPIPSAGTYTLKISGNVKSHYFSNSQGSAELLKEITQWGDIEWTELREAFRGCKNLIITAADVPNLANVNDLSGMFSGCTSLNSPLNSWDVSTIEAMTGMFEGATSFNQDLSAWNLSNVRHVAKMFMNAISFNQDIGMWDLGKVRSLNSMFENATSFNQDISTWNVSSVTSMENTFKHAASFEQMIGTWSVEKVRSMEGIFSHSGLSISTYDQIVQAWSAQMVQQKVVVGADGMYYCQSELARESLESQGWLFVGDLNKCGLPNENIITFKKLPATNTSTTQIFLAASATSGLDVIYESSNPAVATVSGNIVTIHGPGETIITANQPGDANFAAATPIAQTLTVNTYRPFISVWKTDNPGVSAPNQIRFAYGINNYVVEWEEVGNEQNNNGSFPGNMITTFTFPTPGVYRIKAYSGSGNAAISFPFFAKALENDREKLLDIEQWGDDAWTTLAFGYCKNLNVSAVDAPDLSATTNLNYAFQGCASFNSNINHWDVSNITQLEWTFAETNLFNQPLNNWNVSNVESMYGTFWKALAFNQPLNNWDVSNAQNMNSMFSGAIAFNQPIGGWDVGKVYLFAKMFENARSFNQPLNAWDVTASGNTYYQNGYTMDSMFANASSFNQDISSWDIRLVPQMTSMLDNTNLSIENYDLLLQSWANLPVRTGIGFGVAGLRYCDGTASRTALTKKGWRFIGDGLVNIACADFDPSPADGPFITIWKTYTSSANVITNRRIIFPGTGTYYFEWEEVGNEINKGTGDANGYATITFPYPGTYRLKVSGGLTSIRLNNDFSNSVKLLEIEQWGNLPWNNFERGFMGATNLQITATDAPNLSNVTNASYMFSGCHAFNNYIGHWDVSNITNMKQMLANESFNQDISLWSVNNVENMEGLFSAQSLLGSVFNQDISGWDVKNVTTMSRMFAGNRQFNQNLGTWDVSSVMDMSSMFLNAASFNCDIGEWNVGSVTNMSNMFNSAKAFNQDISAWNVSKVENMSSMFRLAESFNHDISTWNVSSVKLMTSMFQGARLFNNPIGTWNVSQVTDMSSMFQDAFSFNQLIGLWNVDKVISMQNMFLNAKSFDHELGDWNIINATSLLKMLDNSNLSKENYDLTIEGWALKNVKSNVNLGAMGLKYCVSETSRQLLDIEKGWTISGDQKDCSKLDQQVSFAAALPVKTFGDVPFITAATASSGLPITFHSNDEGVAVIDGNQIILTGAGTATITAKQAGNDYYAPAEVGQQLVVNKGFQEIVFSEVEAKAYLDAPFELNGIASSGLTISYSSSNPNVATISGNTVTIVGLGSTVITATQPGNQKFNAAIPVEQTLTIGKGSQTITFNPLEENVFGDATFQLVATSSSGLPITYSSSNADVATISGNLVTIVGAGSATIQATQAGNDYYLQADPAQQMLIVKKAQQEITFSPLPEKKYGDDPFAIDTESSSGLPVTLSSSNSAVATVSGNEVTIVGAGETMITASQPGNINYDPASSAQPLIVQKQDQVISFEPMSSKVYGSAAFDIAATVSSGLPLLFESSDPGVASISGNTITIVGAGSANITASQPGNGKFNAAPQVEQMLTVTKANQLISFDLVPSQQFGASPFNLIANATSNLPITFISSDTDVVTIADDVATIVGYGPVTITASQKGSGNFSEATPVHHTFCVYPPKPSITSDLTNPEAPVITSSNAQANQWYGNNTAIQGATQISYVVTEAGSYKVRTEAGECLSEFSEEVSIIITSINDLNAESSINLYPNPVIQNLTIQGIDDDTEVSVISATGVEYKLRSEHNESNGNRILYAAELAPGVYVLIIKDGKSVSHRRLIKK